MRTAAEAAALAAEGAAALERDRPSDALAARADLDLALRMAETPEDKLVMKHLGMKRKHVVLVDRSASMDAPDGPAGHGRTRWTSARDALRELLAAMLSHNVDGGVSVVMFDHEVVDCGEVSDLATVDDLFEQYRPRGQTYLHLALTHVFERYLGKKRRDFASMPGTTVVVLLDGGADFPDQVVSEIRRVAHKDGGYIDNHTQLAISLVQIGDNAAATRFLTMLDNDLGGKDGSVLDVVDTKKDDELFKKGGAEFVLHQAIWD